MNEVNERCLKQLRDCELRNRIAVIGSGLSMPASVDLNSLVKRISNRVHLTMEDTDNHWDFFEKAHDHDPEKYFATVHEAFTGMTHVTCRSYYHITAIPFQGFVTFNYDDQLPEALRQQADWDSRQHFTVYPSKGFFSPIEMTLPPRKLIAVHGYKCASNPNWHRELILRLSDYNDHYILPGGQLNHWWKTLLLASRLVFIGTSLREPGLYQIIKQLIPLNRERLLAQDHLHVIGMPNSKVNSVESEEGFTHGVIRRVYYHPIDEDHSGLLRILAELSGVPIDSPEPRSENPKPIRIGEPLQPFVS